MNIFNISIFIILFGLTGLCYRLPQKNGKKLTGIITSIIIGIILLWTFFGQLDLLVIFIWPTIFSFQLIFISYWTFRFYKRRNIGVIISILMTLGFLFIALQPWIEDWTFNKKDTQQILSWQDINLQDNFEILKNESGGFTDYYQTFTLKISKSDYSRISNKIRSANNYLGKVDLTKQTPMADYESKDTINYETENYLTREYYTKRKMKDGTFHFTLQLSKKNRELSYIGSNE